MSDVEVTVAYVAPTSVTVSTTVPGTAVSTSTELVEVQELGVLGPTGPQGPPGRSGVEYSLVSVSSWSHAHDFPYYPSVHLVDNTGQIAYLGATYPDASTVNLSFPQPFTGTVVLS